MTIETKIEQTENIPLPQKDGRLRQAQLKMVEMLKAIDTVCQNHHLDYWLEGGTLLGAIRHRGFIPWDDDLDISMTRESYEAFLRVAPDELPEHLFVQTPKTDPGYFCLAVPLKVRDKGSFCRVEDECDNEPYHQGIFIDIFVYDPMPGSKLKRKLAKLKANKILRLLTWKYSNHQLGHHAKLYRKLSRVFSKQFLETELKRMISKASTSDSRYLGYGFDCVNRSITAYDDIFPLQKTEFEGEMFNIAHKPEVILQQLYGDYMSLPPEEERVMQHCHELIPYLSN